MSLILQIQNILALYDCVLTGTRKYIRVFHGKGQQIVRLSCSGPEYRLSDCGHTLLNYEDSFCSIVGIDDTEVSCNLGTEFRVLISLACVVWILWKILCLICCSIITITNGIHELL